MINRMKRKSLVTVYYRRIYMFAIPVSGFISVEDAVRELLGLKDAPISHPYNQEILKEKSNKWIFIRCENGNYFLDVDGLEFGRFIQA